MENNDGDSVKPPLSYEIPARVARRHRHPTRLLLVWGALALLFAIIVIPSPSERHEPRSWVMVCTFALLGAGMITIYVVQMIAAGRSREGIITARRPATEQRKDYKVKR